MLEVSAALEIVLAHSDSLGSENGPLSGAVLGRVIAEDVLSDIDSPPYAKSIMDGYAVRSAGTKVGAMLTVIEEVAAGRTPSRTVNSGEATRVMTGAPIPDGADAVIPYEETELIGNVVKLNQAIASGQYVLQKGREMKAGERVVPAGTAITPAAIGLLSAVGRTAARIVPSPRLTIISTGDELVEPSQRPGPSQIRNSNGSMLLALAAESGASASYLGIARDEPAALRALVSEALDSADVVLLSGGVSAGKFDFVPDVLHELGMKAHFHKIRMKPGKPLLFGTREKTLVFGLPGNPVSSFVCFHLFVRPALRKMGGHAIPGPMFVNVLLAADLKTRNDRPTYLPGRLEITKEGWRARGTAWFGSADLRGLLDTNALIRVDAGDVALPAGSMVATLPLNA